MKLFKITFPTVLAFTIVTVSAQTSAKPQKGIPKLSKRASSISYKTKQITRANDKMGGITTAEEQILSLRNATLVVDFL